MPIKFHWNGKEINLTADNTIIKSNNFSVDRQGIITATGGTVGGFGLTQTEFNTNLQEDMSYTQSDVNRIRDIIMGNITPTSEDFRKYDMNRSDTINTNDYSIVNQFVLGTREGKGRFVINSKNVKEAIQIVDLDKNWIAANIGLYGSSFRSLSAINGFFTGATFYYDNSGESTIVFNNETGEIICRTVTQTSKAEDKKNFEKLQNGLDIIKATDIYKYNLKGQADGDKKHIGFVIGKDFKYANEITAENENKEAVGVDTYSMIAVAYKAIQEQQEQIEKQQEQIKQLQDEIKMLKGGK